MEEYGRSSLGEVRSGRRAVHVCRHSNSGVENAPDTVGVALNRLRRVGATGGAA